MPVAAAAASNCSRATRGSLRVWCYAPGYHDGDGTSLEAMRELTGFQIEAVWPAKAAWAEPTAAGKQLGLDGGFGVKKPRRRRCLPPPTPRPRRRWRPIRTARPPSRCGETADGWSLFVGPPGLTSRAAPRWPPGKAGVHLFTQTDCNVYANGPYLVLHASDDGPMQLDTGRDGEIVDLLTGERLGRGPRVTLPMRRGETRFISVTNGE